MTQLQNCRLMLLATLIGPWVVSSGFIALTKVLHFSLYEALHLAVMDLLVVPTALTCLNEVFTETMKKTRSKRVA